MHQVPSNCQKYHEHRHNSRADSGLFQDGHSKRLCTTAWHHPVWLNDDVLANVCKHNVTRFPYELARLAQDIAGGIMVTLPSEAEFRNPETGPLLKKYLKGKKGVDVENRMRILRLIENMTMGRNAVGYLTESMHGAGSPQAQRIQIARQMQLGYKKQLAKNLAKVKEDPEEMKENSEYFKRVFKIPEK